MSSLFCVGMNVVQDLQVAWDLYVAVWPAFRAALSASFWRSCLQSLPAPVHWSSPFSAPVQSSTCMTS